MNLLRRDTVSDVLVIGAGPAGLMAAITAARCGEQVVILEKNKEPGKKLLLAGSGRCNITHAGDIADFLDKYGPKTQFVKPALCEFTNEDTIRFFQQDGVPLYTNPNGKVFPVSENSRDIRDFLVDACKKLSVEIRCNSPVAAVGWMADEQVFEVHIAGAGSSFSLWTRRLILATGGQSYPSTGSSGDGYRFADSLGHTVVPPRPALTPVIVRNYPFTAVAGISLEKTMISQWRNSRKQRTWRGDVLFTHKGLSGPGILDFSRYIQPEDVLRVSLIRPDTRYESESPYESDIPYKSDTRYEQEIHCTSPVKAIKAEDYDPIFQQKCQQHGRKMVKTVVSEVFGLSDSLATEMVRLSGIPLTQTAAELTQKVRKQLVSSCVAFPFVVDKLGGWDEAMVTAGGVSVSEIDRKTMRSRRLPALSFCGEVVDVDGDTGGYNLQFALSSARLAGTVTSV